MNIWNRLTARSRSRLDTLGFAAGAAPSADEWLAAFTGNFMGQPNAEHATLALMSGVRFYTPAFVAQLAALPPINARQPAITGNIPRAIYTATGPIIAAVYQNLISRHAGRADIEAAFARATPALVGRYNRTTYTSKVRRPVTAWLCTVAARESEQSALIGERGL
jgi:hypothetical protein